MCGICGIYKYNNEQSSRADLQCAMDLLSRRGPDDEGIWAEDSVGLGHRRLSILDITNAGHQPMVSRDGRYVIVHNGEIYNYIELRRMLNPDPEYWQTNSDTEVILAAFDRWGTECLQKFHGMFAFTIWDRKRKILFAARDRMGVKPFYYHSSGRCFAFASRPRALLQLHDGISRTIDYQALRYYLESGYIPGMYSIYRDIWKLPPAHYLLITEKTIHMERYWEFRHIEPANAWTGRSEDDILDELDEILSRSICSRLVSDVPLGAFLSGGIDSTLVVAIMAKYSTQPVKTFTIGFHEHKYDESDNAQAIANYLETEHHCEYLQVDELLNIMPTFFEEYDEPFFDSSAFPMMAVSRLARQHVTVSLSGDGGDELFGGYHYYRIAQNISPFFCLPENLRYALASLVGLIPHHKTKLLGEALRQPDMTAAYAFMRSIAKDFGRVLTPDVIDSTQDIKTLFGDTSSAFPTGLNPAEQGMRLDAFYTLPDEYLQKVDVASMAYSLEARDPLLDQDLVEWAMKLPLSWKVRKGINKYLLRKLAYRYVPKRLLDRPKKGFEVPIDEWLCGPLKRWAEERLHDKPLFDDLHLDQSSVLSLWRMHQSGRRKVHPLLWALLMLLHFKAEGKA